MTTSELNPTPASQWKRATEIQTLPSGMVARLKRVAPLSLIMRSGNIPDSLAQIVFQAMNNPGKKAKQEWTFGKDDMGMLAELIDTIARAAFVEPAIVDSPDYDANQIALEDVDEGDKIWLMTWAMNAGGQADGANRFPEKSNGVVSTAQAG